MKSSLILRPYALSQASAEPGGQFENTAIANEGDGVAQSVEDGSAMSAGRQVRFDVDSELFTYIAIEIVRQFPDDVEALNLHIPS